jgi:hypothetical protein
VTGGVLAATGDLTATDLDAHLSRGSIRASFLRPPDRVLPGWTPAACGWCPPPVTRSTPAPPPHAGHLTVEVPTTRPRPGRSWSTAPPGDLQIDYLVAQGTVTLLIAYVPDATHWRVVVVGNDAVAAYRN